VTDAIITLAEVLLQKDFRSFGRTVQSMGIDPSWSPKKLATYLRDGNV
jgi:hypothetical protein